MMPYRRPEPNSEWPMASASSSTQDGYLQPFIPLDEWNTDRGFLKLNEYPDAIGHDVESGADKHLHNTTVHSLCWNGITVTVTDKETKEPRLILDNIEGVVQAGELCALMGPSGSGKTTLLNQLAGRPTNAKETSGSVLVNGAVPSRAAFRNLARFVEQEDALVGSLTVRETLEFSSRLASSSLSARERRARVDGLLAAFGLREQADALIGTPIRKGISGGQKRRVGVAGQLITGPRVLFLDEPTSGLDSAASREVVGYLREVARKYNLIVIASIHQPSTATFALFDKLCLLSRGQTHYFGPVDGVVPHYAALGLRPPQHTNTAEWLLDLVNVDFAGNTASAARALDDAHRRWRHSDRGRLLHGAAARLAQGEGKSLEEVDVEKGPGGLSLVLTLIHRSFIKSYRDVVAYGIRLAMYTGLAVMMGTVWLRLSTDQASIIPFTNAIFFGSAFMSFMAVAYVPSFLEDRQQYVKEHHNGLYGATALMVSNFLIGIPYLFLIAMTFSTISYWLNNLNPTGEAFFTWVMWVFLDLLAAESLVVFFTALFPSFVISLALVAFANGLWMSVNGFMVQPTILNSFYKYVFHYWDYQKYVFEGMMVNEFARRTYSCGSGCQCMYITPLAEQCLIDGRGVLAQYGYEEGHMGRDVGIMIAIIAGYRLAGWVALMVRNK